LKGINLSVKKGEVHAIMGPNGSGKSTLSSVIAGNDNYEVNSGSITFEDEDLLDLDPDQRAHRGVFLSFQYPVEIPGISVSNFIKAAITEKRKVLGLEPITAKDLLGKMKEKMDLLDMQKGYLSRNMNEGFSGGVMKFFKWPCLSLS
jgi:Fe-S cluster assembly ATP-binding protein